MFRLCGLLFFCWVLSPFLAAQIQWGDLFDGDFGTAIQAPRSHVKLTCRFNKEHLVVQADITPSWHLYSVTQPGGTIPSTFQFEQPELFVKEIRPTTAPKVVRNAVGFDVDLEEHDRSVTWILAFQEELPTGNVIKGKWDGMVCQSGPGGNCIPLTIPFEAVFDPNLDVKSLQQQASRVADRFVFRTDATSEGAEHTQQWDDVQDDVQEAVLVANFWIALLFAFLGGIILNVMPCVLPIIGLKILSFFEQAGQSRAKAFMLNAYYSLGILSVFLFLAWLSLGLSYLFTFELFGILMACIVFVMALSLMDIWMLSVPGILGGKTSGQLTNQEGALGAFFKGILTTLLAIPCGAPLLSPAVNWADRLIRSGNMPEVFLMYAAIGLGMASPYLLIGAFPEWLRFLPKPGKWMETFKKTMGFCLLLAVVWILYFLPLEKLLPTVTLLFALWFVCWLFGEQQLVGRVRKRNYVLSLVVLGLALLFSYQIPGIPNSYTLESAMRTRLYGHEGQHWQPYTAATFAAARSSGKMVIIDFTADWCPNCKFLAATVLHAKPILKLLDEKDIVSLEADCTRRESEASELLLQYGPHHVPVLAIFDPAKPKPIVIRGMYTQNDLLKLLQ